MANCAVTAPHFFLVTKILRIEIYIWKTNFEKKTNGQRYLGIIT